MLARKPGSSDDVILRNGDELIVPKQRQEVMVLGEVQDPTSHLYKRRMTRDDYIDQSGGLTRQADRRRIYVVRADGSVDSGIRGLVPQRRQRARFSLAMRSSCRSIPSGFRR